MPNIRLSEADRERLGCPELLPVDLQSATNREAIALSKLGFNTPRRLAAALISQDTDGEIEPNWTAWTALVWLALRRAGVEVDPLTLEFDIDSVEYIRDPEPEPVPEPEVDAGKAEDPEDSTS